MNSKKTCIVTGGGMGIGRALTELLLNTGYRVAVFDLDPSPIEASYPDLIEKKDLMCQKVNIADKDEVKKSFAEVIKVMGDLDLLVNNAGILSMDNFFTEKIDGWEKVININLTGTFSCCKNAVENMKKNKKGCIINVVSISGLKESKFSSPSYCASKAGVIGMSRCLAAQVAEYNIRVNCVAPSTTKTTMISNLDTKTKTTYEESVPLGRLAEPDDIANAVVFLASDKASYITGEIMNVNGGLLMP